MILKLLEKNIILLLCIQIFQVLIQMIASPQFLMKKGFTFLYYLQSLVGEKNFQTILQNYIKEFKYQSINYNNFRSLFESQVINIYGETEGRIILKQVDWEIWINVPGFPIKKFDFNSTLITNATILADLFIKNQTPSDAKEQFYKWQTNPKLIFLNTLFKRVNEITNDTYANLRDSLNLTTKQNAEISNLWNLIGLSLKQNDIIPQAQEFLAKYGRMKYIRPLYKAFYLFNKELALSTFNKNKVMYHPIAVRLILQDFHDIGEKLKLIIKS